MIGKINFACFALLALNLISAEPQIALQYSDEFQSNYPVRGAQFQLEGLQQESPVVVWDIARRRKATVCRTRGDKYPYEDQKCIISVEGAGMEKRILSAHGFRVLEVSWVTAKLILIKVQLGHMAGIEAIYDVEKDAWVYRESVTNVKSP